MVEISLLFRSVFYEFSGPTGIRGCGGRYTTRSVFPNARTLDVVS